MNQEQRRKLYEKGFNDGVESTQDYMVKALYGAAALAAHREFGFGSTRCQRLLNKMDQIVTEIFTSWEVIDKAWEECGLPGACLKCKYGAEKEGCYAALKHDVLELLKSQEEQKFFVGFDGKITPLPVHKHGNWIPIKAPTGVKYGGVEEYTVQEVMCSECGFTDDVSASIYTYCPNCGARMDEEVKQDET